MNNYICNKCYCTKKRTNRLFKLTQCGHIFCHLCIPEAEKQCPKCRYRGAMSIPLQEPLASNVAIYFTPLNKTLETLKIAETFQISQRSITLQRFHELDKKYEILKQHYLNAVRYMKHINQKYVNLKEQAVKMNKKIMFMEMHSKNMLPDITPHITPSSIYLPNGIDNRRIMNNRSQYASSMSMSSTSMLNQRMTPEGFLIPNIPKVPKSVGTASFCKSDVSSIPPFRT